MKNILKPLSALSSLLLGLTLPHLALASAPLNKLKEIREGSGYAEATETSVSEIIGRGVSAFLGLLGAIFIILMLYGGYNWMTAGGEEAKIDKAKKTITQAIIGVVIVTSAYAIWNFVWLNVI